MWMRVDLGGSKIKAVALGADGDESIRLRSQRREATSKRPWSG